MRGRSISPRRLRAALPISNASTISASSRSRFPAASMRAATTTWAISASWASIAKAWRTTRSFSAVRARRTPRSVKSWAPASIRKALPMLSKTWSPPTRSLGRTVSACWTPIAGLARVHSRNASMPADRAFTPVADGEPLPAQGPVLVSLARFRKERDLLLARPEPLGLRLEAAESPELAGDDIHKFAIVVLNVPYFRDGRAFSWARLLRTRLGYKGEIRVTGHVLRDQIAVFARVGVYSFELPRPVNAGDIEAARSEISHVYQPSVDGQVTIWDLRARRRQPPSAS